MSEGLWKLYAIIVSGVFVLAGAGAAIMWPDANVERQTDVQFVTLAMAILSKEVTEHDQRPLREWAIEIINEHSKVEISGEAKTLLLEKTWQLEWEATRRETIRAVDAWRALDTPPPE